jgi:site-specific DNA-adenine methylase
MRTRETSGTRGAHAVAESPGTRSATVFINLETRPAYNGLWRVNRAGEFNVPSGRYDELPTILIPAALARGASVLAACRAA